MQGAPKARIRGERILQKSYNVQSTYDWAGHSGSPQLPGNRRGRDAPRSGIPPPPDG